YNIDLSQVRGTGVGGRITKQDVEAYMASQGARTVSQAAAPPPAARPPAAASPAPAQAGTPAAPPMPLAEAPKTRVEAMSTMRRKIAEHMVASKQTSAHVTTVHRVDMTKIVKLREKAKAEFQARNGFSLTFLSFIISSAFKSLRYFFLFYKQKTAYEIVYHTDINIGIAVALDEG